MRCTLGQIILFSIKKKKREYDSWLNCTCFGHCVQMQDARSYHLVCRVADVKFLLLYFDYFMRT